MGSSFEYRIHCAKIVLLFLLGPRYLANGYFKGALLTISDQIPCTPRQCIEGHVILEKLQRRDLLRISEDTDADALSVRKWSCDIGSIAKEGFTSYLRRHCTGAALSAWAQIFGK